MPKQNEEKIVSFNKEQMFNLVADIDRYSEFLPWCNKSTIVKKEKRKNVMTIFPSPGLILINFLKNFNLVFV